MTCAIAGVDWVTAHADVIDVANMSIRAGLVDADNPLCAAFSSDCTVPQSDPNLGFSGDPDGSPEPLLYLGTNCVASPVVTPTPTPIPTATPAATPTPAAADYDGDGVPDSSDNCPAWPNADQSQPPWPIETGDPACDGWATDGEAAIGTDPMDPCPDDQLDAAWPPDLDNSKRVNTIDVLAVAPMMQQQPGDPGYDQRFDLGGGDGINIIDVLLF